VAKLSLRTRAIIKNGANQLLLVRCHGAAWWHIPGGGVRAGESLSDALRRELQEELGVSATVKDVRTVWESLEKSTRTTYLSVWFDCALQEDFPETLAQSEEIAQAKFFTSEELAGLTINPPAVKQFPQIPSYIYDEHDVFPWRMEKSIG